MTVQVREAVAEADPAQWLSAMGQRLDHADQALLSRAYALAVERYPGCSSGSGEPLLSHCRAVASILLELRLDAETLAAALSSGLPVADEGWQKDVQDALGPEVAALVGGLCADGPHSGPALPGTGIEEGRRPQRPARSAAQDAARHGAGRASSSAQARRSDTDAALPGRARRRAGATDRRARYVRAVRAARQPAGHLAAQVGDGGPRASLQRPGHL